MSLLSSLSELKPQKSGQWSGNVLKCIFSILFFLQTTAGYADISTVSQCCILLIPYYDFFVCGNITVLCQYIHYTGTRLAPGRSYDSHTSERRSCESRDRLVSLALI